MKIQNIQSVQLFKLGELFKIETGKDLIYRDLNNGKYPVVSHTALNNGVNCYTEYLEEYKLYNHNKTIALADRGNFFASVQPEDFYVGTRVKALYAKFNYSNIFVLMYIATLINKEQFRFAYGRNATDKTESIEILLPVIKNSKNEYEPNWQYMESYIKEKYDKIEKEFKTENSNDYKKINKNNWKNFKIGGKEGLFEVFGSKTTKLDDLNYEYGTGKYPYVTTQSINNGVAGFYDYYTEQGNVLVADSAVLGFVTYQEENFTASDHVEILKPKFKMNKYIALFLTTILNKENYRYSYGRKFNQTNIKNTIIKLPAIKKDNGEYEPNWQYMENYIKSLPYGDLI